MSFVNQTDARAHQVIRNLATNLAMKGALPPEAARQMCDGFVSRANLLQAQQAMIDARANGDGRAFSQAAYLHRALGVAMQFQDAHATRVEGRNDARESLMARQARDVFGVQGGVPQETLPSGREGPGLGELLVVGALFAGAAALMSRGRHDDHHHHNGNRVRRLR